MQQVDDSNFIEQVIGSKVPVLVKATAPWCAPCRAMQPGLEQAAEHLGSGVKVVELNIDKSPVTYARLRSPSIPTLFLYRNGREITRHTGAVGMVWILKFVAQHLA